ncbi:MAG: hypothetical protein CMI08_17345 [Oceanospirillaceae bacterium]|uniref:SDR family NAD(P)-dependent oxidoreductase n=1 Tax=unclassified Thalassolituus TaxID=2624967 RepID=UPI000C5223AB|nr:MULTISPECIES: SDR family oxidoreductase [unclassified Thalassolituus]MAS26589.1 hypothetical protein [Oceanospirillaceae bacterium]MAY00934.1 hypothetical protein [Oceanospirillaceae bacterium]MBL34188.1 hypothetical protein [Oceanospirillaceae bacterium]MBS52079.1 hypothetical protein [Oceanospirillaceae bacterium]|tara:strand:+ start:87 stop:848 length:762 start_codon:yes stop_codon:yes gene_type:complete
MSEPKIALITGGSRGLGANAALALAERGVDSIVTYRNNRSAADVIVDKIRALGGKALALQLDTGDSSSFSDFSRSLQTALTEHWQTQAINYLVNNAGHGHSALIGEMREDDFDELYRVHVKGPYFLSQTLLPVIADGGAVLNISSGLARFSLPGSSAYACMKGAVEVMSRYQAKELALRGIRVNTLAPGAIATDFAGGTVRDNPDANGFVASVTALARAGEADDIGPVIASLLSDDNHWITGQRIEASGGMFL